MEKTKLIIPSAATVSRERQLRFQLITGYKFIFESNVIILSEFLS